MRRLSLATAAVVTSASSLLVLPAAAQVPNASAAAAAMGDNFTAAARGLDAAAWNPASLGLAGNPGVTFALFPVGGTYTFRPLTFADLKPYAGKMVPDDIKEVWLRSLSAAGGQTGAAAFDITYAALSIGPFALQASTSVRAVMNVDPAFMELLMFGNAGRTGQPRDLSFDGDSYRATATSTLAMSYGHALYRAPGANGGTLAFGATGKYILGNFRSDAAEAAGGTTASPVTVNFRLPMVQTNTSGIQNGNGFGLDLGLAWSAPKWGLGVALRDVVNTFSWNLANFYSRSLEFHVDDTHHTFSADSGGVNDAPATLRRQLDAKQFAPTLAAGASIRPFRALLLTADVHHRLGESLDLEPQSHVGVGAEIKVIPFLPLRAGYAGVTGGYQLTAGGGLDFKGFHIDAAVGRRRDAFGTVPLGMISISGTDR